MDASLVSISAREYLNRRPLSSASPSPQKICFILFHSLLLWELFLVANRLYVQSYFLAYTPAAYKYRGDLFWDSCPIPVEHLAPSVTPATWQEGFVYLLLEVPTGLIEDKPLSDPDY